MPLSTLLYLNELYRLRRNVRLGIAQLERIQYKKLKRLINYAYNNVSYYRRLLTQAGISPADIKTKADISKIPITAKSQIQSLPREEITSRGVDIKDCLYFKTSGSTGEPLTIILSEREYIIVGLFSLRMQLENSYHVMDKMVCINEPQYIRKRKRWFHYLGIGNVEYISCFENTEEQVEKILKIKPQVIKGRVSSIKALALEMERSNIDHINPKLIFCTAEFLDKKDRELISTIFDCEVIDYYSTTECGNIAWECREHKGYHIDADNVVVEFIKNGSMVPAGEEGEIIITVLNNYTMPLIRYKIGDTGILGERPCPCGISLPLLETLGGRINDQIILPNGKVLLPYLLLNIIEGITGIVKYQIVQEGIGSLKVSIVKNEKFSLDSLAQIKRRYREAMGYGVEVEPIIVDEILQEKGRKFKLIVSEFSKDEDLRKVSDIR